MVALRAKGSRCRTKTSTVGIAGVSMKAVEPNECTERVQISSSVCMLLILSKMKWWPGRELNPRHADFQSAALPTELPGHPEGTTGSAYGRDHGSTFILPQQNNYNSRVALGKPGHSRAVDFMFSRDRQSVRPSSQPRNDWRRTSKPTHDNRRVRRRRGRHPCPPPRCPYEQPTPARTRR